MEMNAEFWRGKSVFLTGHTGFKGSWLSLWLQSMGAEVHGFALEPPTKQNIFTTANVQDGMVKSTTGDIREMEKLIKSMQLAKPQIVFHLAAQPLVRYSYEHPVETYSVNVMGTVHMLEAARATPSVKAVVNITTDKCYENREWVWGYRENEAMGGFDPYSSSKGCAELVTSAYRQSFFDDANIGLASVRAGNVIGGGDWAEDRLVPDLLRSIDAGEKLIIRSPDATRPWQHVLEPLSGYLLLAEKLHTSGTIFSGAWNFGPADTDARPVRWIIENIARMRKDLKWEIDDSSQPHEAGYLKLDSSKASNQLSWYPQWKLKTALQKTLEWHEAWHEGKDMRIQSLLQITDYLNGNGNN